MTAELVAVPVLVEMAMIEDGFDGDLTADQAEQITTRIRQWANSFPVDDVVCAYRGRVWVALAYDSWAEWCECELGGLKLPVPQRREVVAGLADAGMSNPAIADAIGVDQSTVYRDKEATGFANANPVTGQDGKEYSPPSPRPAPQPESEIVDAEIVDPPQPESSKPRRKPITESFDEAIMQLTKVSRAVEGLSEDDRFSKNKDQVALKLSDLIRARDAVQRVIDKFN